MLTKEQKHELSEQIGKLVDDIDEQISNKRTILEQGGDYHGDLADAAQAESDTGRRLITIAALTETRNRLCERYRALLYGDFDGLCGECGGSIGFGRLVGSPCASKCIDCAKLEEFQARKFYKPGMVVHAH